VGQFGSLYDMMHYSTRNHTAFATANYEVNARLSFFANLVYNDGRGSLGARTGCSPGWPTTVGTRTASRTGSMPTAGPPARKAGLTSCFDLPTPAQDAGSDAPAASGVH
jgi:hypothetical protein